MTRDITRWLAAHRVDPAALVADEIVGIGHALAELRSLAGRLRHPDVVAAAGAALPRGILLHGRPGTGKTTAARWFSRLVGDDIPVYEVAADELTAARIRALFKALAGRRTVLLLDEIDAIGERSSQLDPGARAAQAALLRALDGLADLAGPVVVACTTSYPDGLEPALVRHGRLGMHVHVSFPTTAERRELFETLAARRGVDGPLDLGGLAGAAHGWTPAAIHQAFDDALGFALAEDRTVVTADDLGHAVRRDGRVESEQPEFAGDPHRLATHEAGHVAVAVALFGPAVVTNVEIRPRGGDAEFGGIGASATLPDPALLDSIAILYGGIAAERLILGDPTANARDVSQATRVLLARLDSGLDQSVSPLAIDQLPQPSERTRQVRDAALAREADHAMAVAETAVDANRVAIERFAAALEAAGTLRGAALADAIRDAGFTTTVEPALGEPLAEAA
jgi:cell division protease FtsH